MRIAILCGPMLRVWQVRLADALRALGHEIECIANPNGDRIARDVDLALKLEKRLFKVGPSLFDLGAPLPPVADKSWDLVVALDGEDRSAGNHLTLLLDGAAGEAALVQAVACCSAPSVRIKARVGGVERDVVRALLAVEHREVLSRALDQVLARLVPLIVQAVRRVEDEAYATTVLSDEPPARRPGPRRFMLQGLARKGAARLPGAARGPNHWRTGFRFVGARGGADSGGWDDAPYAILPDDNRRFYADPVPFQHEGRNYIFFEDFPYATGKGTIGVVELAADGTPSPPRTVLEQPFHLSYPLIIRHGYEIYMLPEMSGAGRIQLFRAERFPDRWVPDRILVQDVAASDATPIVYQGRWWLFATLSDDGGSTWDQLGLFHAPDLLGPWEPHRDNPVLVDAGAARPAGAMWIEDGAVMRVAQDCRTGYGVGLAICRVDRLDETGFSQSIVTRLGPPKGYDADGVHTLNRAGALEVIDLRFASTR